MKTNKEAVEMIKLFEGCRLTAYLDVVKVPTIGYGHTGQDVKLGQTITQSQAEALLMIDLERFEKAVNSIGLDFNSNQFSALVSFAYNCGVGNLKKLCNKRTIEQIGAAIPLYNKAGGKVLQGLVRRRKAEQELYNKL